MLVEDTAYAQVELLDVQIVWQIVLKIRAVLNTMLLKICMGRLRLQLQTMSMDLNTHGNGRFRLQTHGLATGVGHGDLCKI